MLPTKFVENIKTHILCSQHPPAPPPIKSCKKYGRGRQATDVNIMRRMRFCMLDN